MAMDVAKRPASDAARRLTSQLYQARSAKEVLRLVKDRLQHFDHIHTTACLHALAKNRSSLGSAFRGQSDADRILSGLIRKHGRLLLSGTLEGRQLANTLWALAKISNTVQIPGALARQTARTLPRHADRLNHLDVANSLWALATLHASVQDDSLSDVVASLLNCSAMSRPSEFQAQGLSNCLWALATLECESDNSAAVSLAAEVIRRPEELEPQQVANTLWAWATINLGNPDSFAAVAAEVYDKGESMKAQEVANVSWSLATMQTRPQQCASICAVLARAAEARLADFKPQELMNVTWAFAVIVENCGPSRTEKK